MKAYLEIEMPKSCYYCSLTNDGYYLCKATSPFKELEDDCEERRPDWCPLIPAADVRPAVKAVWKHVQWVVDEEWQEGGYWISRCSNCLMPYNTETPFCPHCGADMREES